MVRQKIQEPLTADYGNELWNTVTIKTNCGKQTVWIVFAIINVLTYYLYMRLRLRNEGLTIVVLIILSQRFLDILLNQGLAASLASD